MTKRKSTKRASSARMESCHLYQYLSSRTEQKHNSPASVMKDVRVVSTWTDLTRDSAVYLLFTFSAIKVSHFIYRCFQSSETSSFSMETHPEALRRERILSSKLYFNVPETKVSIIYSSAYDISFMGIEKL